MITFHALNIAIDYSPDLDSHNRDFVGYVIQKYPRRVVKATILTRVSVPDWYDSSVLQYPNDRFTYLIGSVSLIGEINGTTEIEDKRSYAGNGKPRSDAN